MATEPLWSIVGPASVAEGETATYTVSYTGFVLEEDATITIATAVSTGGAIDALSGTDYTALSSVLTFTVGGATTKTIAVSTIEDTALETNEDYRVTLTSPSAGSVVVGAVDTAIADDDISPAGGWHQLRRRRRWHPL